MRSVISLPLPHRRLIFFLVLALCGALNAAQTFEATPELLFQIQPLESAWQQNTVTSICQTRDGYLWLGTYHGLVRYDGARFVVFDAGNSSLPNGIITSLFEDYQGTLWIGHETGQLSRYWNYRFSPFPLNKAWPGGPIEAISADAQNDLWLLNNNGSLRRLRDEKSLEYPRETSPSRKPSLARGPDGNLYVISSGALAVVRRGTLEPIQFKADEESPHVEKALPARDGSLWIAANGRLRQWRNGNWVTEWEGFPTEPGAVTTLLELRNGAIVAGTIRNGLFLLDEHRVSQQYSRSQGLSHSWVRALCEDHEGNVWAATGNGFNTLVPRKIGWLSAPDLFQGCAVLSLAVTPDGSAWMGTEGAGLYHYSTKGLWTRYGQADGVSNLFVWSVLQTRQQKLLASTWGGGVLTRKNELFEPDPQFSALPSPVLSMFERQNGALWVGTTTGLREYKGGKEVWSVAKDRLALPDVRAITEGPDGTIWFGMSGGGLGSVKDGKVRQFRKSDGAGSDFVLCVHADNEGSIWYGTADNGLVRVKDSRFDFIRRENGLPSVTISHIVQDGTGDFWLGSLAGLLRARKEDLENCANGVTKSIRFLALGRDDGMLSQTCSGGFQPGACRAPDGRLWFPTSRGVAIVNPATVSTNLAPPPVLIEEFRVDTPRASWSKLVTGAADAPRAELRIPPGRHRIQIRYTGLSYAAPTKVRFRHRLEGLETEWVDAGTRREAEYAYLRPGQYRFRVIGCNNDDVWNEDGAEIAFAVLPFFWQTLWFQTTVSLAGGLAIAAGVWGVSRRRVRRKVEQLERQRALERERARIARDIHDDLGASLTRITMLSQSVRGEVQNLAQTARDVDAIYDTARNLTRSMDEIVWAVNPKHDSLDSLVTYLGRFAQAFLSSAGLRCRLDLPLNLPPYGLTSEVRHNVFLAFKEALNNVIKHARATEVRISLEIQSNGAGVPDPGLSGFALVVTDNGRGFEFGAQEPDNSAEARLASGNGIYNMRKRLEEIGGACDWTTAPGEGARVRFTVPSLSRHQKTGQSFSL